MLPRSIQSDIDTLLREDAVFSSHSFSVPDFSWKKHHDVFPSLLRVIVAQQLSTKAADTIWQRVVNGVGGDITPVAFADILDDDLCGFGLSRQKISYLRGVVDAVVSGDFIPDSLVDADDETVLDRVTSLKGFGIWSAQMILIFTLHRQDIWPSGDLGIREGVRKYMKLPDRPSVAQTDSFGDKFKGRRTAAALLLWRLKDSGA